MQIKVLGIKMPKKKRKSSLGRLTANAKYKQKTRLNEDEKTYSQRTEIEKERQVIGRINENSEHRDQRLAVRRYKDNLTSKTIIEENWEWYNWQKHKWNCSSSTRCISQK